MIVLNFSNKILENLVYSSNLASFCQTCTYALHSRLTLFAVPQHATFYNPVNLCIDSFLSGSLPSWFIPTPPYIFRISSNVTSLSKPLLTCHLRLDASSLHSCAGRELIYLNT